MSNYSATIVRITNLTKHPNADRLQLTSIFGNTVIVGLDVMEGDLGVFFPLESQLSEEFATANDLIRRKDENGKAAGGMLEQNRRVRAIKLRGTPSMGLWLPLTCLDVIGGLTKPSGPLEGFEFEEMNGVSICQKYVPKHNVAGGGKKKEGRKPRESRIIENQFRFHFDTAQLGKNVHKVNPDDVVVITWKLHGTSAIVGNCLVKRKLGFIDKLLKRAGVQVVDSHYDMVYASRRVVKNEFIEAKQHFYSEDLWSRVGEENFEDKLHTGEQVYYEIVGFTQDGSYIQKDFDYGCEVGKNKIFVYRITQTAVDGSVIELQWNQVKHRCGELGVPHVPEIYYGKAEDMFPFLRREDHWHENILDALKKSYVYDQDSQFCKNRVPEEGICVRSEGLNIEVFKLKSFRFLEAETKSLDAGTVDVETEQTV